MRPRQRALIITFASTAAAMEAERFCMAQGLPGRIIPVPRAITASCGLAWKAPPEAEGSLSAALREAGLSWEAMQVLEI